MTAPNEHIRSLIVQPLPQCLAPDPAQRAAFAGDYPTYRLPEPGDLVIIDDGYVTWLIPLDDSLLLTGENTLLAGAPLAGGEGCHGAEWASASPVDPDDECLDEDIIASLREARRLLIEDATAKAGAMTGACAPVATGADIGPEHHGEYVEITTRVTEEAAALGLGGFGEWVTVRGTVYRARRVRQAITQDRITLLFLRVPGFEALMPFHLDDCDPARLIAED